MSLERFFDPQSVAIVGASRVSGKVGHELLAAMVAAGYKGKLYAVNPHADSIEGVACYASLKDIGDTPDLVLIAVAAKLVPGVVQECAGMKVKAVVIVTSGFKETGEDGAELEHSMVRAATAAGMRIIGPNCIGIMAPANCLNASFAGGLPRPGPLGYFSQSGSIMAAILDMAKGAGLGFSKLVSIGNKADVDELDVIRAFGEDPDTKVIAGYLETIADGDAFVRQTERISRAKPILLIKSGVTATGARAASSHTGRLAGTENAYECVFERAGVIRCASIPDQFDLARAFASQPLPTGPNLAVIANAGGAGIMAADAAEREGLVLAGFSPETTAVLAKELSGLGGVNNPIDLLGDAPAERYEVALRTVLRDDSVDAVLVILSPHAMTECRPTADMIVRVTREDGRKPVFACFLGAERVRDAVTALRAGGVPQYDSPESAMATIKSMWRYAKWRSRPERVVKLFPVNRRKVSRIVERHLRQGVLEVGEMETKEILQAYGFVTPRGGIATSPDQAVAIAVQVGYPVVLKVWSPDIIHKSELGGVAVNLSTDQAVKDAFDLMMYRIPKRLPNADIPGILVERMSNTGQEVILGMSRDPRFGPLMMFGMGGKLVEVLEDVVFYPAPLTAEEAKEMLVSTRTYQLLAGVGGEAGVDIDAIAEGLQRLSQLVTEFPQIKEIDINPFVVGREGTTPIAVDAMMGLEPV